MNVRRRNLILPILLLIGLSATTSAQGDDPEYPVFDPTLSDYDNIAAILLAEDIKDRYNGNVWGDSVSLSFEFVTYDRDGTELKRTKNEWNRATDRARYSGRLDDGSDFVVEFSSLSRKEGVMLVDSQEIPEQYQQAGLDEAYNRLVGNIYWLMMPMLLLDERLTLEVLPDTTLQGKPLVPLIVTFNDSNLVATSARLYVDRDHKTIERWRIDYDGTEREFIHRMTRRIGPYLVATRLWSDDFASYVQLERIKFRQVETMAGR